MYHLHRAPRLKYVSRLRNLTKWFHQMCVCVSRDVYIYIYVCTYIKHVAKNPLGLLLPMI